jgi:guanylate kinase
VKNLFLIDGASATGKSDLLKWVVENNANDVVFVVKGTTRSQRPYERSDPEILLDLEFLSDVQFDAEGYDYTYAYGGARYGFARESLLHALMHRENVFVIVRSTATIDRIARDFSFINVVPIFIYTDRTELRRRLRAAKVAPEVIQWRLERSNIALQEYYSNPSYYREVLINNSSRQVFHSIISKLIAKHAGHPPIDPHLLAVAMSFNEANPKLVDYFDAMQQAAQAVSKSYHCERVDMKPGIRPLRDEFHELTERARCVIADLTENRPNVYYELGSAQARRKPCLITAEKGTDVSFYPKQYKILFYESATDLRVKLTYELGRILREFATF